MVQNRLGRGKRVKCIVERQHILPGPVEVGYFMSAVGLGQMNCSRLLEIAVNYLLWDAYPVKALPQSGQKGCGQAVPLQPVQVKQRKGIPSIAVNGKQTGMASQGDDMEVPAETAIRFLRIRERFEVQVPLEGNGQAQLYRITSFHEE